MNTFAKRMLATGAAVAMALPFAALAQIDIDSEATEITSDFNLASGQGDLRATIIGIVQWVLSFLGLVAVIIILYGGFVWMTAGGNEEKISSAKGTLTAGLIGLVIILSAWAITNFVVTEWSTRVLAP